MKSKCENCPYNRNELGNGCGNDACIQEAMMFDGNEQELKESKSFGSEITTEMLLEMIENKGWEIGDLETVVKLDYEAHNIELQEQNKKFKHQLVLTEKALELACEELGKVEVFDKEFMECESFYDYFKTKAKEMMKSD